MLSRDDLRIEKRLKLRPGLTVRCCAPWVEQTFDEPMLPRHEEHAAEMLRDRLWDELYGDLTSIVLELHRDVSRLRDVSGRWERAIPEHLMQKLEGILAMLRTGSAPEEQHRNETRDGDHCQHGEHHGR